MTKDDLPIERAQLLWKQLGILANVLASAIPAFSRQLTALRRKKNKKLQ